jgi:hypothetical protein
MKRREFITLLGGVLVIRRPSECRTCLADRL